MGGRGISTVQKQTLAKLNGLKATAGEIDGIITNAKEIAINVDVMKTSTNLFDINACTQHTAISSGGVVSTNLDYHSSDYISVEAGDYYFYGFLNVCKYDANKTFISRVTIAYAGQALTFDTNTKFIRMTFQYNNSNEPRQLNRGNSKLPYEYYYINYSDEALLSVNKLIDRSKDSNIFNTVPTQIWRTDEVIPDYTSFGTIQYPAVHTMFDNLLETGYCTKELLTPDSFGYAIPYYRFTPTRPTIAVTTKKTTILIVCGIHGFEHASTLCTFLAMQNIRNNWETDATLEFLRWNVDFIVLPVANPSGWNDFTRKTRNGIDINRNFPWDWIKSTDTASSTYPGVSPASEIETQNIMSLFTNNTIDFFIDFHNFHLGSNGDYFAYFSSKSDPFIHHLIQNLYSKMTREWKKDYTYIPDDYFIGFSTVENGGMSQNYAQHIGVKRSSTFEVCNRWVLDGGESSIVHGEDANRCGTELLINWILINLADMELRG